MLAAAALGQASPAAAETNRASLPVSANVVASCLVSTEPQPAGSSGASAACSSLAGGSVAIDRNAARPLPPAESGPATVTQGTDSLPGDDISYVTITY